jgi:hypothetical protein
LVLRQGREAFFEAAHVYRLKGEDRYLNVVEAIGPGDRRFYKAFVAARLDGEWEPLADSWETPFAAIGNVAFEPGVEAWTDCVSHGELLREGDDERMVVDPKNLRFLYQGCTAAERAGKKYGELPWRLGLLRQAGAP